MGKCIVGAIGNLAVISAYIRFLVSDDSVHSIPLPHTGMQIMLMLGESVLSLLIVGLSDEQEYYIIVLVGVLTIVMLQDLHYESQPLDADTHAMAGMRAGNAYVILIQFYSLALIFLGASYKYMLDLLNYKDAYGEEYESGYESGYGGGYNETYKGSNATYEDSYSKEEEGTNEAHLRLLGGSIVNPEDAQKSKEYVVWLYCLSLVFVLVSLELMLVLHQGIPWKRWLSVKGWTKEPVKRVILVFFLFLKIGILVSFAFYATNSTLMSYTVSYVTFFGGAIAFIFLTIRIIDWECLRSDSNE